MFMLATILTASLTLPGSMGDNPYATSAALHAPDHGIAISQVIDPKSFTQRNSPAESIFEDDFGN